MKCKNCGATLKENARVCQNCGAFVEDSKGYTLLTADDSYYSSDNKKEKKSKSKKGFGFFVVLLLIIAIAGGASYYYFTKVYTQKPVKPEVSFSQGIGVINDDERVVYVKFNDVSNIQFIHSVSLYNYDKTQNGAPNDSPVTSNYEYTKSIDSTFRAIFFDADNLKLTPGVNYTYTFEINLSFIGSNNVYTYEVPVEINNDFSKNVSDEVFDHSMDKSVDSKSVTQSSKKDNEKTTLADVKNNDYVYDGYWFTAPLTEGGRQSISSYRFNKDNTFVKTDFVKNSGSDWNITTNNGSYSIEDGYIVIEQSNNSKSLYYKINANDKSLIKDDSTDSESLTNRKYNSVTNVEDFFAE